MHSHAVTKTVTPPPHAFAAAPNRCLRCGASISADERTCSPACRQAVHRRRRPLRQLVRAVLLAQLGETPETPPPFWWLIRGLVTAEVARLSAEQKAKLLPGVRRG